MIRPALTESSNCQRGELGRGVGRPPRAGRTPVEIMFVVTVVTKGYKFERFGDSHGPRPYDFK